MKNKQNRNVVIIVFFVTILTCVLILFIKNDNNEKIPDDYVAIFHGGSSEQTYRTYIYKINNGETNRGFKYINVTSTTEYWGSPNWINEINDDGEFNWIDEAFIVAKKHGAYSFVTIPHDYKTDTIEEFQARFIMN